MFVWLFHRVSGVILLLLITWKIFTGYACSGRWTSVDAAWWLGAHQVVWVDLLLLGLFIYHSLYGLRTILIDAGLRGRERLLLWLCSGLGLGVWGLLAVLIYA